MELICIEMNLLIWILVMIFNRVSLANLVIRSLREFKEINSYNLHKTNYRVFLSLISLQIMKVSLIEETIHLEFSLIWDIEIKIMQIILTR